MNKLYSFILIIGILAIILTVGAIVRDTINELHAKAVQVNKLNETLVIERLPIIFAFPNEDQWSKIEDAITNTTAKHIIIKSNGLGGVTNLVVRFTNVIKDAQRYGKKISIELMAGNISGHGYTACAADEIIFHPGAYIKIHASASLLPNGAKDYYLDIGETVEFVNILKTCKDKFKIPQDQIDAIVKDHKALFIYRLNGKTEMTIGEDF